MSELWNCSICYILYNNTNRIPKLIPSCGHTVCSDCLAGILKTNNLACPLDRLPFSKEQTAVEKFPKNMLVLQLLEDKLNANDEICKVHNSSPKVKVCLTEACLICTVCANDGSHSGHEIISFDSLKSKAETKRKQLESLLEDFDNDKKAIETLFEQEKKNLQQIVQDEFDKLRGVLARKEKEIYSQIDCSIEFEKFMSTKRIGMNNNYKEEALLNVTDLKRSIIDKRYINTIAKSLPNFSIIEEYQRLIEVTQKLESIFLEGLQNFSSSVTPVLQSFQTVFSLQPTSEEKDKKDWFFNDPFLFKIKYLLNIDIEDGKLTLSLRDPSDRSIKIEESFPSIDEMSYSKKVKLDLSKGLLTKDSFKAIQILLKEVQQIYSLELDLTNCKKEELELFTSNYFWCSEKVKKFALDLHDVEINQDLFMKIITTPLERMKGLDQIYLDLGNTGLTDSTLKALTLLLQPRLSNLVLLKFDLYETKVTDDGVGDLFLKMNGNVSRLKDLQLSFYATKLTEKCIKTFSQCLIPNLEDLELLLGETQITDQSIQDLSLGLKGIAQNLRSLILGLDLLKITDKSMVNLSNNVLKNAIQIKRLGLYLNFTKVSEKGVRSFLEGLKYSVYRIEEFILQLTKIGLSDKSVLYLSKDILPSMNNLKSFNLCLDQTQVTDSSIKVLTEDFKKIINQMQDFCLSLKQTRVTKNGVSVLRDYVKSKKIGHLKTFGIQIDNDV